MEKSLFKQFLKYSFANILSMTALSLYILADTFFVSSGVGIQGLTSLNLALPVFGLIYGFAYMLGIGGATYFSIAKERKNVDLREIFTVSLSVGVCLSLFFAMLGLFFSSQIATFLGASGESFQDTKTYVQVILLFAPAFSINHILTSFTKNNNHPKVAMWAMIAGSLSNIVLDYIFIFPLGMGILGAALATGCSPLVSVAIQSRFFFKEKEKFALKKSSIYGAILKTNCKLGFATFISEFSNGLIIFVFNIVILKLAGDVGVAAYAVIANVSLVCVCIFTGIAQGVQPLFSKTYARYQMNNLYKLLKYGLILALSLSVLMYIIIFLFSEQIINVFNKENSAEFLSIASYGIKIYFTAMPFVAINILFMFFFSSTTNALQSIIISLLRGFALLLTSLLVLSALFEMTGVWLSLLVTEFIVFVLAIILLKNCLKKWKKYRVEKGEETNEN